MDDQSQGRVDVDADRAGPARGVPIAEAARLNGISVHTLRYYERCGMLPVPPARTSGNRRRYGPAELDWIHTCTKLRGLGMSTDLIRRYVDLVRAGPGNEADRLLLLEAHRDRVVAQMAGLSADLEHIEGKIAVYRDRVGQGSADGLWSVPRGS